MIEFLATSQPGTVAGNCRSLLTEAPPSGHPRSIGSVEEPDDAVEPAVESIHTV